MTYRIVFGDLAIGETDFERSFERDWRGAFRPLASFHSVERTLRPYGSAEIVEGVDETGRRLPRTWIGEDGRTLAPLRLRLLDPTGRDLPADYVRLYWPGDVPGIEKLEIHAWGEASLPGSSTG